MARLKGLEPPAYCLEGSCSIQLSYWRISAAAAECLIRTHLLSRVPPYTKRKPVFVWERSDCPYAVKRDRTGAPEAIGQAATWSGRRESNPRIQLGRLVFCH